MAKQPVKSGELVGRRLGKYEILSLVAVGGAAEIYLARVGREAGFEKYLVIKCLLEHLRDDPEAIKMFLDEARIGAQLEHSNIVQTLELVQLRGHYYLAMEYLSGLSLAQLGRRARRSLPGGVLPEPLVLGLAAQACGGLHYAHERAIDGKTLNLVHRDVTPQNLIVTFDGVVKVVDFGIAISNIRQTRTHGGTIKGKCAYLSPEQCRGEPVERSTDVYSLGVICHELLTGERLFKKQDDQETFRAILGGHVKPPSASNPQVTAACDEVVLKALAYDRSHRYATAKDFGEALLGVIHRAGHAMGPAEIAGFCEDHFSDEIEAHAARMRNFGAGNKGVPTGSWDVDDEPSGSDSPDHSSPHSSPDSDTMVPNSDSAATVPAYEHPQADERLPQRDAALAAAARALPLPPVGTGDVSASAIGVASSTDPLVRLAKRSSPPQRDGPAIGSRGDSGSFITVILVFAVCALVAFGLTVVGARWFDW